MRPAGVMASHAPRGWGRLSRRDDRRRNPDDLLSPARSRLSSTRAEAPWPADRDAPVPKIERGRGLVNCSSEEFFSARRLIAMQSMLNVVRPEEDTMASITIRNLEDDLKRRLRIRAAEHGRSM